MIITIIIIIIIIIFPIIITVSKDVSVIAITTGARRLSGSTS
jgi:hypothetical protein